MRSKRNRQTMLSAWFHIHMENALIQNWQLFAENYEISWIINNVKKSETSRPVHCSSKVFISFLHGDNFCWLFPQWIICIAIERLRLGLFFLWKYCNFLLKLTIYHTYSRVKDNRLSLSLSNPITSFEGTMFSCFQTTQNWWMQKKNIWI